MIEIKFFVRIRGALTPPPMIEEPVMKMPLPDSTLADVVVCPHVVERTMPLLRHLDRCIELFRDPPMRMEKRFREIGPPGTSSVSLRLSPINASTYIESFSFPVEQHIYKMY